MRLPFSRGDEGLYRSNDKGKWPARMLEKRKDKLKRYSNVDRPVFK